MRFVLACDSSMFTIFNVLCVCALINVYINSHMKLPCLFRRCGLNRSIHMDYLQCYELLKAIVELTFIEGT